MTASGPGTVRKLPKRRIPLVDLAYLVRAKDPRNNQAFTADELEAARAYAAAEEGTLENI